MNNTRRDTSAEDNRLRRGQLRCLLLGIRGTGMTALAEILSDLGHLVVGADASCRKPLCETQSSGHEALIPWNAEALIAESADICIHTPAIATDAPLLNAIRQKGTTVMGLHECLSRLFHRQRQLCVSGTHGKSTSAAMLTWIMHQNQRDPSCFVGGELMNLQRSGRFAGGDWSILEACEFSSAFEHFNPDIVLLTGIQRDHFDRYPDAASEDDAFRAFLSRVPESGTIVANGNCRRSLSVAREASGSVSVVTCGLHADDHPHLNWSGCALRETRHGIRFDCHHPLGTTEVRLRIHGRHNVRNAVSAMAAAAQAGIDPSVSAAALATFAGVRRRFEIRGQHRGAVVLDDYGHHPTAITATLRTAREVYPDRRLVVVFEPHQISRTKALFREFAAALSLADETLLLPVFPARENVSHFECCRMSGMLVKELNRRNHRAFLFANLDQTVSRLDHAAKPTDLLITMGAGTTNLIYDQLTRRFQRDSVA